MGEGGNSGLRNIGFGVVSRASGLLRDEEAW